MSELTTDLQHSEKTILALCKAQHNSVNRGRTLLYYSISTVSIAVGTFLSISGHGVGIACIMLGCWAMVAINQTPQRQAKAVIRSLQGHYAHIQYAFFEKDFVADFGNAQDRIAYVSIARLISDREYFYILLHSGAIYMFDKDESDTTQNIKDLLSRATHLSWTANRGFRSFSLFQILRERKNTKR